MTLADITIDAGSNFIDYTETEEVASFIYKHKKDEVYRDLNIKSKNELIASLDKQNNENTINYCVGYISEIILDMNDADALIFITENYDEDFSFESKE